MAFCTWVARSSKHVLSMIRSVLFSLNRPVIMFRVRMTI
ncbi:Uncharacterised protein [Vibrio cholerae]|nr:Uncharacterised protein [Vibrio cholerae]